MRTIVFAAFGLGLACGHKAPAYSPPAPAPAPAPAPTPEATELPGTYEAGLGNPVIRVTNGMSDELSLYVVDASGADQAITVEAGQYQDITVAPGAFSFTASEAGQSVSGEHTVEADNAYDWSFTPQDATDDSADSSGGGDEAGTGEGSSETVDSSAEEASNGTCPDGAADCGSYCCIDSTFCCDQGCCRYEYSCPAEAPVECGSYCCYPGTTCAGNGQCQGS